jgi:ceramide glucosyltransferase
MFSSNHLLEIGLTALLEAPHTRLYLNFWREVVLLITCVPMVYYVVATLAAVRFFSKERAKAPGSYTPPVSVLKPVRGVDFASYENFQSFCLQDYPEYEILFCVNDLEDEAVPLIHRLIAEFPERSIRLLSNAAQIGSNRKVNNLALLAREAKYELLVQSDGDVRVERKYLREMAAPFKDAETGAESCFYRGLTQHNLLAEIEALGVATDFSAGVLVADWMEGVTFALGASVATTKRWLAQIGGYEALANVLADDYEIGNRIAKAGGRVRVSREVVATLYPAVTFGKFWAHQARWARTVRLCRPASYVGLLFTQGLPSAIAGGLVSGSISGTAAFLGSYLLLRLILAWTVGVWGLRDETTARMLWMVPLRDALHFAVWLASFFSNRIIWGESEFQLTKSGEMVEIGSSGRKKAIEKPLRAG